MATVSGQNKNKVQVSNNQARYYSEEAQKYAQQAGSYATSAGTSATLCANWAGSVQATYTEAVSVITSTTSAGVTTIEGATTAGLGSIGTATTNGVGSVNSAKTEALTTIQGAKTSGTSAISAATTAGLGSITTAGTSATSSVQAVGTSVVSATTSATEAIKTSVVNATTTAVSGLTSAAVGSVNSASTNALNSISSAKTSAVNTINSLKTEAVTTIQTLTTQGTTTINNAKTDALNTINAAKTSALTSMSTLVTQTQGYATNANIWAEGTDEQVQALGGTHSAKEWCLYNSTVNQNDVRALESGLNQGEVYRQGDSDSINSRLSEIKSIAHSTFDASKFTVVGSPNITDDGIASGFSDNNYIKISDLSTYIPSGSRNFELDINFNLLTGSTQILCANTRTNYKVCGIWVEIRGETNKLSFRIGDGSDVQELLTDNALSAGEYNLKFKADGTNYILYLNGNQVKSVAITQTIGYTTDKSLYIAKGPAFNNVFFAGSIDLKQFSITVDGVPVFSGNKTGIDTIKPDNYTVVGSPTISADGIVSNLIYTNNLQNQITKSITITQSDDFIITIPFKKSSFATSEISAIASFWNNTTQLARLWFEYNTARFSGLGATDPWGKNNIPTDEFELNKEYIFEINKSGNVVNINFYDDNYNIVSTTANDLTGITFNDITSITIGMYSGKSAAANLSVNLNSFKVYVDGNLVYQPCLKIPYTESKTGSKIVNSIYRDRVDDMANQFGYANYYTLSDTDFTLPQVELYGLIGQRTLRDSYRNGATYWELWSDRTLEIGGTCTSGVEYNLPRNFTSENDYILSVPYSAKTASSFTPTVSGDFIAKGLGVL